MNPEKYYFCVLFIYTNRVTFYGSFWYFFDSVRCLNNISYWYIKIFLIDFSYCIIFYSVDLLYLVIFLLRAIKVFPFFFFLNKGFLLCFKCQHSIPRPFFFFSHTLPRWSQPFWQLHLTIYVWMMLTSFSRPQCPAAHVTSIMGLFYILATMQPPALPYLLLIQCPATW